MASPTSSASCSPCSDTPLGITTSVITFLTFLYALTVGLIYYYGLAKSSAEEIAKFIEALSGSLRELNARGTALMQMAHVESVTHVGDAIDPQISAELCAVLSKLEEQIRSLDHFRRKVDRNFNHSSRSARWFKQASRIYYLLIREELQQKVVENDRLMTDLRHIHQSAERAEDAKAQDVYRKKQENVQFEQLQMLESILRRVIRLEASEKTTTQGETSSPDPPPASAD